jgi:glycosyltransferase involved in cell wall biosynthesis
MSLNNNLHIVFFSRWIGFPHGMAASQRMGLLARAMVENGMRVKVLCMGVSERPSLIENSQVVGTYKGIEFEYTTGTTVRSESFLTRNWISLKGVMKAIITLLKLKFKGQVDCAYCWLTVQQLTTVRACFITLLKILRISVVIELNERPWTLQEKKNLLEKRFSPLSGVRGVIVISSFLCEWTKQEAARIGETISFVKIPILVDVNEQKPDIFPSGTPSVLFAGSPYYDQTIQFIFDAMSIVWEKHSSCNLIITGCRSDDPGGVWVSKEIKNRKLESKVWLAGYLPRQELLEKYSTSWGLLIPLFDDTRSKARFPTKIGEYLASGRPVVTNSIGEATNYLEDGVNAFICPPDNYQLYGKKIIEVIENRERAEKIGLSGRQLAEKEFHYSHYGKALQDFFKALA